MEQSEETAKKYCSNERCEQHNPQSVENFHLDKRWKSGRQSRCKACRSMYGSDYRAKHREKDRMSKARWKAQNYEKWQGSELRRKFWPDLTPLEAMARYSEMLKNQNGVCLICKSPETALDYRGKVRSLSVDHCYTTGRVRGLLCRDCNTTLGKFSDDPIRFRRAAEYLEGELGKA